MTKSDMLCAIAHDWNSLTEVLCSLSDGEKLEPNLVGKWSVKDLMAHLSSWESVCLDRIGRVRRDEEIVMIPDAEVHVWNARFQEQQRNVKFDIVQGEFESVHARLVYEIETLPDELWERIDDWIADNTYQHYREHLEKLTAALAQRGMSIHTKAHK
ncbi:MAG: ClbS/DfsB family four-helix bundle protein [Ignavibacteria bacterium]|nr:ClbS/DfsB family four-helix bundle protein [Ignavibacteria bacterium]